MHRTLKGRFKLSVDLKGTLERNLQKLSWQCSYAINAGSILWKMKHGALGI